MAAQTDSTLRRPRDEAVDMLDAFWRTDRDASEAERKGSMAQLRGIAHAQATHAQIAALIYVGDQLREIVAAIDEIGARR